MCLLSFISYISQRSKSIQNRFGHKIVQHSKVLKNLKKIFFKKENKNIKFFHNIIKKIKLEWIDKRKMYKIHMDYDS